MTTMRTAAARTSELTNWLLDEDFYQTSPEYLTGDATDSGAVRVEIVDPESFDIKVSKLDEHDVSQWDATFSNAPLSVIRPVIREAMRR